MTITRWSRVALWFPAIFGTAALLMLVLSMISTNLNFDEAYNLQVVNSMVGARTYASYGVLDGLGPWPFDPHVTTGVPAMVSVSLGWWVSGGELMGVRVVMLGWLGVYVWGCLRLLRPNCQVRYRQFQQLLVCAPVLIIGFEDLGDFRGELPASALAILALLALDRRRFVLAGAFSALAALTKLVLAPLIPLVIIGVFSASARGGARNVSRAFGGAFGVVLMHEAFRMVTVGGWLEYQISIVELRSFVHRQRIPASVSWYSRGVLAERWDSLLQLATPGFFVFMTVVAAFAVMASRDFRRRSIGGASVVPLMVGVVLAPIMLLGWAVQSKATYSAQILPALLVAGPAAVILSLRGAGASRILTLSVLSCSAVLLAAPGGLRLDLDPLSPRQHALRDELAHMEVGLLFSNGWYQSPVLQLLLGIPAVPWPAEGQVMVVGLTSGLDHSGEVVPPGPDAPWSPSEICGERFVVGDVELCHVRSGLQSNYSHPAVVNWGERTADAGHVPNPQVDGQAGFWVVVDSESRVALSPLRLRIEGRALRGTEVSSDGDLLTALAPPMLFDDVGQLTAELENLDTGMITPLGTIDVVATGPRNQD